MTTYRARRAEVLSEGLSRRQSSQRAGSAAVVGERLNVDHLLAVVLDDGLLGEDAGGQESSAQDRGEGLHCDNRIA